MYNLVLVSRTTGLLAKWYYYDFRVYSRTTRRKFIIFTNSFLTLVNGEWGAWGIWSNCTEECGTGETARSRLCDNPLPQFGGANCTSNATLIEQVLGNGTIHQRENKTCNEHPCPS
jgi:hypothetical protein